MYRYFQIDQRLTTDYNGASTIHTSGSDNSALKEITVLTPFVHKMTKRVGERQQRYFSKIDLIM